MYTLIPFLTVLIPFLTVCLCFKEVQLYVTTSNNKTLYLYSAKLTLQN